MQWGDKLDFLKDRKKSGKNTPALDSRPILKPGLDFYLIAFKELSYDANNGFGQGSIPWTAIDRWAQRYGLNCPVEFETLVGHVRSMEKAMLDFRKEQGD